jgi:hypothetical protein
MRTAGPAGGQFENRQPGSRTQTTAELLPPPCVQRMEAQQQSDCDSGAIREPSNINWNNKLPTLRMRGAANPKHASAEWLQVTMVLLQSDEGD